MGIRYVQGALPKGTKAKSYHNNYSGFGAINNLVAWKKGYEVEQFTRTLGVLDADDISEMVSALSSITKKDLITYKKETLDKVLTNPIEVCSDCDGVGVVEVDSMTGAPIYPRFCSKCSGVGKVRDIYNTAEYVSDSDVSRLLEFLSETKKVAITF